MDETERRQALAAFLRTRRARLQPADVGLPSRSRRRTAGLRREEVAELANIGVSWYTLLEQGHDVHPSRQVLESLARALRLTAAEEQHLFLLAGQELSAKVLVEEAQVTPALQRVVDALNPHPAFVIGRRWDVLTWNRTADLLFHFHQPYPPHSRNVVWRFFQRGEARTLDRVLCQLPCPQRTIYGKKGDWTFYGKHKQRGSIRGKPAQSRFESEHIGGCHCEHAKKRHRTRMLRCM